jgi:hypothetical protein
MTEKEAKKQALLQEQETITRATAMCEVCLELDELTIRFTNNLNYMKPTTNICRTCIRRLNEKIEKK